METLIHADVFFFVTTIAVVLVGIVLIVALVYVVKILRNVRDISETLRSESGLIAEDVHDIRAKVRDGQVTAMGVFHLFRDLFTRKRGKRSLR